MQLADNDCTLIRISASDIPPSGHFNTPSTITRIGNGSFSNSTSLRYITLPRGLTNIGFGAFSGCTELRQIIIPEGLAKIWSFAFHNCTGLRQVTFSRSLTEIGDSAFADCTSLTHIAFPESLTKIWNSAFHNCTGLRQITFSEGLAQIKTRAFEGCTGLQFIVIKTQCDIEFNRIKALLPDHLQAKVIDKADYEALTVKAAKYRQEALEPLCRIAEINPLLRLSRSNSGDERCKLHLIQDMNAALFHINQFVGPSSQPYRAAEDEMKALPIPLNESYDAAYKAQLDSIVSCHVTRQTENLTSTTSTTGAEPAADAESSENCESRPVRQRP